MILQLNFFGDPNLGLFCTANSKICFLPFNLAEKEKVEKTLGVKAFEAKVLGTNLIGIFCVMNDWGIVLPNLLPNLEKNFFKKIADEYKLNICFLELKYNALGNLILCNNQGAVLSKLIPKRYKEKIERTLEVEVDYLTIANLNIVGACGVANDEGCLLHREVKSEELEKIEKILKVECNLGTVNFGSPFVKSGLVISKTNALIGNLTTAPEISRIVETLKLRF